MCDLIEGLCTFWGNMIAASEVRAQDPTLTFCIASPRQGEEGWLAYDAQQFDPARVTVLNPEECRTFAEEARCRGHWEMAKLIALSVGTAVATAVLIVGMLFLCTAIIVATIYVFALLATIPVVAQTPLLLGAVVMIGLITVLAEYVNATPAQLCVLFCTWTKEGIPLISRSYGYMQHLYERSRELEILGARDPEPALVAGGA